LRIPQPVRITPQFNTCKKGIVVLDSLMFQSNSAILNLFRPISSARARADLSNSPHKKCRLTDSARAKSTCCHSDRSGGPILLFVPLRIERKSPARGAFAVSEYGRRGVKESLSQFFLDRSRRNSRALPAADVGSNSCKLSTYAEIRPNHFRISTYKNGRLQPSQNQHLQKGRGGGGRLLLPKAIGEDRISFSNCSRTKRRARATPPQSRGQQHIAAGRHPKMYGTDTATAARFALAGFSAWVTE
jgi:hypothetical protein